MESTTGAARTVGSGGVRRRFEPLQLASGWGVVDLVAEAITLPRCRWNQETAEFVAASLTLQPGYAAHFVWIRLTDDDRDEAHLLPTVRLRLANDRLRTALTAIAGTYGPGDTSPQSIALAVLEGSR